MHDWSEKDFDWAGINDAARFIAKNLLRWGRVNVRDYKEKWGCVRVYCSLGWAQLHSVTHPRYVYGQYPQWLWHWDVYHGSRIIPWLCNWAVVPYHKWLYRRVYKAAITKWPHLACEILHAADYHELLEGLHVCRQPDEVVE